MSRQEDRIREEKKCKYQFVDERLGKEEDEGSECAENKHKAMQSLRKL